MGYIRRLFYYFWIVFFVNYLFPGIDVVDQTKLPHIGGDIIFAFVLGFLNSLIVPILKITDGFAGFVRVALSSLILNFAAYALLKLLPIGVLVTGVQGYLMVSFIVSVASIILSFVLLKKEPKDSSQNHGDPS
jgi:hypothetical protein